MITHQIQTIPTAEVTLTIYDVRVIRTALDLYVNTYDVERLAARLRELKVTRQQFDDLGFALDQAADEMESYMKGDAHERQ